MHVYSKLGGAALAVAVGIVRPCSSQVRRRPPSRPGSRGPSPTRAAVRSGRHRRDNPGRSRVARASGSPWTTRSPASAAATTSASSTTACTACGSRALRRLRHGVLQRRRPHRVRDAGGPHGRRDADAGRGEARRCCPRGRDRHRQRGQGRRRRRGGGVRPPGRRRAWFRTVVAGADGTYDVGGLSAGEYTLGFRDPVSGVAEYWSDRAAIADADPVTNAEHRPLRRVPGHAGRSSGPHAFAGPDAVARPDADAHPPRPRRPPRRRPRRSPAPAVVPSVSPLGDSRRAAVTVVRCRASGGWPWSASACGSRRGPGSHAVTRTVQWLANGKEIKNATKNRLRLTSKLVGKRISVRVVATATGRTPITVTTRRTKRVAD